MVVTPIVEGPVGEAFGMIAELVVRGNVWIAGDLGASPPKPLEYPQILGRHLVVRPGAVWTEQDATKGVAGNGDVDVGMVGDKGGGQSRFRFGQRIWSGAPLIALRRPFKGEVAVEVEPLQGRRDRNQSRLVVVNGALGEQPVVLAALLVKPPFHHQPVVVGRNLPVA